MSRLIIQVVGRDSAGKKEIRNVVRLTHSILLRVILSEVERITTR